MPGRHGPLICVLARLCGLFSSRLDPIVAAATLASRCGHAHLRLVWFLLIQLGRMRAHLCLARNHRLASLLFDRTECPRAEGGQVCERINTPPE